MRKVAALAALRDSEHVVRLESVRVAGEDLYLELELADRTLADGPVAPGDSAAAFAGLVRGLAALHRRGWVHRDVTPKE